jgi:Flp pilus assembly pilin Flp
MRKLLNWLSCYPVILLSGLTGKPVNRQTGKLKAGQSTLEYAVLIVVIIAALIAVQVYLKRGIQGRMRQSSDQIGEQFSPGYTTSNRVTNTYSNSTEVQDAYSTTTVINNQFQNQTGWENVLNASNEYWGK